MTELNGSLKKLEQALHGIRSHFLYSEELSGSIIRTLNQDALAHSNSLELDNDYNGTLERLKEAWEFAVENFNGTIDEKFITRVANSVKRGNYKFRGMGERAMIKGKRGRYILTNHAKIRREMGKLLEHLTHSDESPALKAAELHLYFVLIHPFCDGNGRTARLLQNLYLQHQQIPPVLIRRTERGTYLNHIEDALIGFRDRCGQEDMFNNRSFGEYRFFEYIIDKILGSTEKLAEKIKNQRKYQISLTLKGSRKTIYGVRNALRKSLSATGKMPPQMQCSPKRGKITLVTCLPQEFIEGVLGNYTNRSRNLTAYKITS